MSLSYNLKRFMVHTVTIEPYSGQDGYAEPSYGAGATYSARVQQQTRLFRGADGLDKVAVTVCYLNTTTPPNPRSRITLPDGTKPPIVAVETVTHADGTKYIAVYTGAVASQLQ